MNSPTIAAAAERDDEAYPGGKMCGFILWHQRRIAEAREVHPEFTNNSTEGAARPLLFRQ
jgi:hypothetical protein